MVRAWRGDTVAEALDEGATACTQTSARAGVKRTSPARRHCDAPAGNDGGQPLTAARGKLADVASLAA
jgi:hypothetical protein